MTVAAIDCPVCAAGGAVPALPYVTRPREEDDLFRPLHLWSCGTCGSHFAEPRPSAAALAEYYARSYRADGRNAAPRRGFPCDHPWYLSRGVTVAKMVRAALGSQVGAALPLRALEVGAGYGHNLFALRRALAVPLRVTAMEPDPSCHDTLGQVADRIIPEDLAAATPDSTFDVVLLLHVLEHVPDPLAFLAKLRSLMAPVGVLALEVPHCPAVRVRWYNLQTPHVPHLFFFTAPGLAALLRRAGFTVEWLDTYGPCFDRVGGYDASFARSPIPVAEAVARGELPPPPFQIFAESGPDRLFLRAIARVEG